MREVRFYRTPGFFRWEARTHDSRGWEVTGIGITKRGSLWDLQNSLRRREKWHAIDQGETPVETREVDW